MRPRRLLGLTGVVVAGLAVLGACRPLYLPLVPQDRPAEPRPVRLVAGSTLRLAASGRPFLELVMEDAPPEGWLAVQWFGPDGREAASESALVEAGTTGLSFELPPDVPLVAGEWRALVSLGGVVLRQFSVAVPPT